MLKRKTNQGKQKKKVHRFVLICVISFIVGAVLGVLMLMGQKLFEESGIDLSGVWELTGEILAIATPYVFVAIWVITGIVCAVRLKKAKRIYREWDGEDDEIINKAEYKLNKCLSASTTATILGYFLFGLNAYFIDRIVESTLYFVSFAVMMISFLVSLVLVVVIQRQAVELAKKINPEKRGDVLDPKFAKEWENSSDEAEMLIAYKAAYKAYKAINSMFIVLWVICLVGEIGFHMGLVPLLFVSALWLVSSTVYCREAIKLENKR